MDDRTRDVIKKSLEKYDLEGKPEDFVLLQLIPESSKLHVAVLH